MSINGRLLLLLVVVGLFVRVWKTNEHPRTRPYERSRSHAAERALPAPIATTAAAQVALPVTNRANVTEQSVNEEIWTVDTAPIPLPAAIAAGDYRIVSDSGRVGRLTIEANTTPRQGTIEMFSVVSGTERWYLIRLSSDGATAQTDAAEDAATIADAPIEAELAPETHEPLPRRKFDFNGYTAVPEPVAPPAAVVVTEQASRPLPPELPSPL